MAGLAHHLAHLIHGRPSPGRRRSTPTHTITVASVDAKHLDAVASEHEDFVGLWCASRPAAIYVAARPYLARAARAATPTATATAHAHTPTRSAAVATATTATAADADAAARLRRGEPPDAVEATATQRTRLGDEPSASRGEEAEPRANRRDEEVVAEKQNRTHGARVGVVGGPPEGRGGHRPRQVMGSFFSPEHFCEIRF